ncbi:DUF4190 domain-containing protein [Actinospica sp. MGRD01-02]|uniref:DUF4190 domain-containing protein n=1 Tax=Actinospica acidithermotolerans TaxID=2828514 RepID=A0A941EH24_9ACTN|nr:DUF4190 domain-containing protein [Actinospica acidithermotolerans]MBR7830633.1 DUF4190 domain-containing protein [Actinospica acidithermotolerans]
MTDHPTEPQTEPRSVPRFAPPARHYFGFDPKKPFPPPNPLGGYAYPADRRISGPAIASLILGLLGFLLVTACAGLGLGLGALGSIRRTGRPGTGLAVAGIVLSAVWLALWLKVLVFG